MSVFYGDAPFKQKSLHDLRHATVGIGHIALHPGEKVSTDAFREKMQESLDLAIDIREERSKGGVILPSGIKI